jgi:hypothetical protein
MPGRASSWRSVSVSCRRGGLIVCRVSPTCQPMRARLGLSGIGSPAYADFPNDGPGQFEHTAKAQPLPCGRRHYATRPA